MPPSASNFDLVVFDMAGTTVRDLGEVTDCFMQAVRANDIRATPERVLTMMGWSKRLVFETLLAEQLGRDNPELQPRTDRAYDDFRRVLEAWYESSPVEPSEGCLDAFRFLKNEGIRIALTTGFYRKVTDIILRRLGWHAGLDANHVGTDATLIQVSITSDEVPAGRPAPYMIHRAMALLGARDVRRVIKIGDTPADLQAGRNAGVGLNLGVANGTHTWSQLTPYDNDGLLGSLADLPDLIRRR